MLGFASRQSGHDPALRAAIPGQRPPRHPVYDSCHSCLNGSPAHFRARQPARSRAHDSLPEPAPDRGQGVDLRRGPQRSTCAEDGLDRKGPKESDCYPAQVEAGRGRGAQSLATIWPRVASVTTHRENEMNTLVANALNPLRLARAWQTIRLGYNSAAEVVGRAPAAKAFGAPPAPVHRRSEAYLLVPNRVLAPDPFVRQFFAQKSVDTRLIQRKTPKHPIGMN